MDEPGVDPIRLSRALGYIRRVNRVLGYTRATLEHFKEFSKRWKPGERITVLDVATGSGDIPAAMLRWAGRSGFDLRVIGMDLHARTVGIAAERAGKNLQFIRADALDIPLADASVDYVMSNMFFHHLDESQIIHCCSQMNRISRRGVLIADLLRDRRARWWIGLFSIFSDPMVRHDATVSVEQALNRDEAIDLARRAGLDYVRYRRHFGHRFVLAGEKW